MKTNFCAYLLSSSLLGAATLPAGAQSVAPTVLWYDAEGVTTCRVSGCQPGTSASFYSKPWGGSRLATFATDGQGNATITKKEDFTPAFVINSGGTNRVTAMPLKTFTLSVISLSIDGDRANLQWKGSAPGGTSVRFEVLKGNDQGAFVPAATYTVAAGSTIAPYYYSFSLTT